LPRLPPRHYPEWDYHSQTYRPDWVSVYEGLHPSAQAGDIDRLLQKHAPLAKRLQRLLELLKPQTKCAFVIRRTAANSISTWPFVR
jgi:hypothetical protein